METSSGDAPGTLLDKVPLHFAWSYGFMETSLKLGFHIVVTFADLVVKRFSTNSWLELRQFFKEWVSSEQF